MSAAAIGVAVVVVLLLGGGNLWMCSAQVAVTLSGEHIIIDLHVILLLGVG